MTSATRIAAAPAKTFAGRGAGSIVNISSAFALNTPPVAAVYGAAEAHVIAFTQAPAQEFADCPARVRVVVPGVLETAIWDGSDIALRQLPKEAVMSPRDSARAALAGLDAGEPVTIPSLPEYETWKAYDEARLALAPLISLSQRARRYAGQGYTAGPVPPR